MIRVLIVEDSPVEQQLLAHILGSDPLIKVVGVAVDGEMALADVARLKPDVVTMDIYMPKRDGFDTTRRIMESTPLPIIIITGHYNSNDSDKLFRAMEAGALAVVRKPVGLGHPDHQADAAELIKTVKTMSEIKVIRRWPRLRSEAPVPSASAGEAGVARKEIRVVAIGASTGGPAVLRKIFLALPKDLSVPVLVVQHMAVGFMEHFVTWLSEMTGFPSHVAVHGEAIVPGHAYFAPDGFHMLVGKDCRIVLSNETAENGLRPAVARLFRSVAETFGATAVGVLLTGMGRDGAEELKQLRNSGAATLAQDRDSSIIFGMPGEAVRIDAADYILAPEGIARIITQLCATKTTKE